LFGVVFNWFLVEIRHNRCMRDEEKGGHGRFFKPGVLLLLLLSSVVGGWQMLRLAQANFDGNSPPPWGVVLVAAVGLFVLLLARNGRYPATPLLQREWPWGRYGRTAMLLGAFGLTAVLLMLLVRWPDDRSFQLPVLLWLAAIGLFLGGVGGWPVVEWQAWQQINGRVIWLVSGLGLLALILRVWRLDTIPFALTGDEASQGLEAVRVLSGSLRNPFSTGWLGVPTMSFFFNSPTIQLLGRTAAALRLPWALVGSATVVFAFLLVRRLKGLPMAVLTAVLLAVYHYHIHFSRLGSNQIADPFFLTVALWLLFVGLDEKRPFAWALSGVVTGLAFYFYAGARLTPVVITAVLAYLSIRQPRIFWQENGRGLAAWAGAFLVTAAPMLQYAVRFPNDFNARLNQVGIFQSGWIYKAMEVRQESMAAVLFDQFQRAFFAFNFYPDRTVWYGLPQPLLDPFFGAIFLIGLGYGTVRLLGKKADVRLAAMAAWWWGGLLAGGMLTESPPSSQRLITLAVPTVFFVALAWSEIAAFVRHVVLPRWERPLLVLGVLAFSGISLHTYFIDFVPQRLSGGQNAEMATTIAPMLNELKDNHRIVFVGAPWMYWDFATLPYLVPDADAVDAREMLTTETAAAMAPDDKGVLFVVLPQREAELAAVTAVYPQGRRSFVYSSADRDLLAILYIVPPGN
jgi:4-amino-4-deoxy-L-arabinose transferase-like glycosyltransferase